MPRYEFKCYECNDNVLESLDRELDKTCNLCGKKLKRIYDFGGFIVR